MTLAASILAGALASPVEDALEPDLLITAHFPEENPFHHVVNGEKNSLYLIVENKSESNTTIKAVAGSFHDPESQALVKNISSLSYGVLSMAGSKFSIPYTFHSELKPGDYKLQVWVDHSVEESTYRVTAYDGVVTVVEPDISIFDLKMISTWLISGILVVAGTYFAVLSLFPSLSKPKRKRTRAAEAEITAPVGTVKASGAGYQEEWIPDHHLKKTTSRRGQRKATGDVALSSGDEKVTSGADSGNEGPRRSKRGKRA